MPLLGLVGDIGGTNARFCLAYAGGAGGIELHQTQVLPADNYKRFADCLAAYLAGLDEVPKNLEAVFGVASPVLGDHVHFTNRDWAFEIADIKARFSLKSLRVVNDFALQAHALPALGDEFLTPLPGPAWALPKSGVVAVVGPGTGLGVSGLVLRDEAPPTVLATEGGHMSFAPTDALEADLLRILLRQFARVSNERLISGPGMIHLYQALAEIRGEPAALPDAPAIVTAATQGDTLAAATIERFCLILAGLLGDVALAQGAAAVAIAGGIAPRLLPWLQTQAFRGRFEAKGRATPVMQRLPITLVDHPTPALLGAAQLLTTQL